MWKAAAASARKRPWLWAILVLAEKFAENWFIQWSMARIAERSGLLVDYFRVALAWLPLVTWLLIVILIVAVVAYELDKEKTAQATLLVPTAADEVSILVAVDEGLRGRHPVDVEQQGEILVDRAQPDLRFFVRNNLPSETLNDVAIVTSLEGAKIIQPDDTPDEIGMIRPGEVGPGTNRQLRIEKPGAYRLSITVLYKYGPKNIVTTLRAVSGSW